MSKPKQLSTKNLKRSKRPISIKEQRFIKYYIQTGNGGEAVRLAGYNIGSRNPNQTREQSLSVATSMANELLTRPEVKKQIDKLYVKENIYPEAILKSIHKIATDDEAARDRLKALELLGKNQRLFSDTEKHDTNVNIVLAFGTDSKPEVISEQ